MSQNLNVMNGESLQSVFDAREGRALLSQPGHGWPHSHCESGFAEREGRPVLLLSLRHSENDPQRMQARSWLAPLSIPEPGLITAEIFGSGSGARISLDCLDGDDWGLRYILGTDESPGWQRFRVPTSAADKGWGPCEGRHAPHGALTPVALHIEDNLNQRSLQIGLGTLSIDGAIATPHAWGGSVQLTTGARGLEVSAKQGRRTLLSGLRLSGRLADAGGEEGHPVVVGRSTALGGGRHSAEFINGGPVAEISMELGQTTSMLWELRYRMSFLRDARLAWLRLAGELPLLSVLGASVEIDGEEVARLDGGASAEASIAEPAVWEELSWGGADSAPLSLRFDGDCVKSVRLLDQRIESERPGYGIEALLGEAEQFSAGSELEFSVKISAAPRQT